MLAVLLAIAFTLVTLSRLELRTAINVAEATRADLLAQGGVSIAIAVLHDELIVNGTITSIDQSWRTYFNGAQDGRDNDHDGRFDRANIENRVNRTLYDDPWEPPFPGTPYDYAFFDGATGRQTVHSLLDPILDFGEQLNEIPYNFVDDDGDGAIDELWDELTPWNAVDNDGDGILDSAWFYITVPTVRYLDVDGLGRPTASNGLDDDGDGRIDEEFERWPRLVDFNPSAPGAGTQYNGIDDDFDGFVDEPDELYEWVIGRYAVLVTDEASKLNINVAGNREFRANQGVSPAELDLHPLPEIDDVFARRIVDYRYGAPAGNPASPDQSLPGLDGDDNRNNYFISNNSIDDDGDALALQNDGVDNDGDGFIDEADEGIDELDEGINEPQEYRLFRPLLDDEPFKTIEQMKLLDQFVAEPWNVRNFERNQNLITVSSGNKEVAASRGLQSGDVIADVKLNVNLANKQELVRAIDNRLRPLYGLPPWRPDEYDVYANAVMTSSDWESLRRLYGIKQVKRDSAQLAGNIIDYRDKDSAVTRIEVAREDLFDGGDPFSPGEYSDKTPYGGDLGKYGGSQLVDVYSGVEAIRINEIMVRPVRRVEAVQTHLPFLAGYPQIQDSNTAIVTPTLLNSWQQFGAPNFADAAWHEKSYWYSSSLYKDDDPPANFNDYYGEWTIAPRLDKPSLLPAGDYYLILNLAGRDPAGNPLFPTGAMYVEIFGLPTVLQYNVPEAEIKRKWKIPEPGDEFQCPIPTGFEDGDYLVDGDPFTSGTQPIPFPATGITIRLRNAYSDADLDGNADPVYFNHVTLSQEPNLEWIELVNLSDKPVNLDGWELSIGPESVYIGSDAPVFPPFTTTVIPGSSLETGRPGRLVLSPDPESLRAQAHLFPGIDDPLNPTPICPIRANLEASRSLTGGIFPNNPRLDGVDNDGDQTFLWSLMINHNGWNDDWFLPDPYTDEPTEASDVRTFYPSVDAPCDSTLLPTWSSPRSRWPGPPFMPYEQWFPLPLPFPSRLSPWPTHPDASPGLDPPFPWSLWPAWFPWAPAPGRPGFDEKHFLAVYGLVESEPGEPVIITLYEGPAARGHIADQVSYTSTDVMNADGDLYFNEPADDFYRSLERKNPLYAGDTPAVPDQVYYLSMLVGPPVVPGALGFPPEAVVRLGDGRTVQLPLPVPVDYAVRDGIYDDWPLRRSFTAGDGTPLVPEWVDFGSPVPFSVNLAATYPVDTRHASVGLMSRDGGGHSDYVVVKNANAATIGELLEVPFYRSAREQYLEPLLRAFLDAETSGNAQIFVNKAYPEPRDQNDARWIVPEWFFDWLLSVIDVNGNNLLSREEIYAALMLDAVPVTPQSVLMPLEWMPAMTDILTTSQQMLPAALSNPADADVDPGPWKLVGPNTDNTGWVEVDRDELTIGYVSEAFGQTGVWEWDADDGVEDGLYTLYVITLDETIRPLIGTLEPEAFYPVSIEVSTKNRGNTDYQIVRFLDWVYPSTDGVVRCGLVQIRHNTLKVRVTNRSNRPNYFTRVVLAPRRREPGKLNINSVEPRIVAGYPATPNPGYPLGNEYNMLASLPGLFQGADDAELRRRANRIVLPSWIPAGDLNRGRGGASTLPEVPFRDQNGALSPLSRAAGYRPVGGYQSIGQLVSGIPYEVGNPGSGQYVYALPTDILGATSVADPDLSTIPAVAAAERRAEMSRRFQRISNLITVHSDVFEITCLAQAGRVTEDVNGDGVLDDRDFDVMGERKLRVVYERSTDVP